MMPFQAMRLRKASPAVVVPEAAGIYAALTSWWDFEQNDGTSSFLDSHSTNHLSARTTAGLTTTSGTSTTGGKPGRMFNPNNVEGTTAYIPRSNTALDLPNSDWTFGGWLRGVSGVAGTSGFVMGRVGSTGTAIQAYLGVESSDNQMWFFASTDGTTAGRVGIDSGTSFTGSIRLVMMSLNRTSNLLELRWRDAGAGSMSSMTASFPSALYTTSNNSNFCLNDGLSSDNTYFSGTRANLITADTCLYMSKVITDAEFGYLYNSGNGLNYATMKSDSGN